MNTYSSLARFGRCEIELNVAIRMVVISMAALAGHSVMAADPQIIEVKPGESADAYFSVNISGKVFIKIAAKPGEEACADFWWIKWPAASVTQLGRHCNAASFEIPGLFGWPPSVSSKLRVGISKNVVKLAVSATEQVANSYTFTF